MSFPTSSVAGDPMTEDDNQSRRGEDEAQEEGVGANKQKRTGNKNRVRINRDQGDIPPVRDDTGEKVTELFQQFLEQ